VSEVVDLIAGRDVYNVTNLGNSHRRMRSIAKRISCTTVIMLYGKCMQIL